jgi:hypothetical protein
MELFNFEIDTKYLVNLLRDNAFTNILALIGGLFGFIAFIMQLPKTIKPILFESEKTIIHLGEDGSTIEKIEMNFSIHNKSKRNCIITDIFARIYESDSYTPDDDIYHVTSIKNTEAIQDFTILYIPSNDVSTFNIELADNSIRRSKKRFQTGRSYIIEIYCIINNKKMKMFFRSESFSINEIVGNIIKLKSITKTLARSKFEEKITNKKKKIHYHNGIIYTFLSDCNHFIKYKIIRRPLWIICDITKWVLLRPYFFLLFLRNVILSNTIFIKYGIRTYRTVTFFDEEGRKKTMLPLKKLGYYLNKSITKINKKSISSKVIIEEKGTEINLTKNDLKLHIYLPGGENIYVQELREGSEINLQFNYRKNYLFNYWHYNKRIITIREMATIILNYFIDWSLYKRTH